MIENFAYVNGLGQISLPIIVRNLGQDNYYRTHKIEIPFVYIRHIVFILTSITINFVDKYNKNIKIVVCS